MKKSEELKALLSDEVLPEIEDYIDDVFELIADNKVAKPEDKADLEEAQELRKEFTELLADLEAGEVDEEECAEIIDEIHAMREEEE